MERETVIVSAVRTAVGSFGGSLRGWSVRDLGGAVIKEALARAGIEPGIVDEVIMGNVNPPASCLNVGKEAALQAGVPVHVPGFSVNRLCGSGLQAINLATMMIRCRQADVVVAGGVENMSDYPYALLDIRWGKRMGDAVIVDEASESLKDPGTGLLAGYTAELLAEKYNITREEQDQFALESQMKAKKAIESGAFEAEILPLEVKTRQGTRVFAVDEHPKFDTTLETLGRLPT
ncbi:MAG: thiolase family protein, partial [Bacillota bacterium]